MSQPQAMAYSGGLGSSLMTRSVSRAHQCQRRALDNSGIARVDMASSIARVQPLFTVISSIHIEARNACSPPGRDQPLCEEVLLLALAGAEFGHLCWHRSAPGISYLRELRDTTD